MQIDAQELRRLRERVALSQRELAERAGLTQATVWRVENGFTEVHPRTIRRLAGALGIAPTWLTKGDDDGQE